jgi:tetratricopeptide (TPR) repeat protein
MRMQNQIPVLLIMAVGLLIASALFAVSPAAADDRETCTDSLSDVDVAIAACARAIASGQYTTQNVATLYTSRGIAYGAKGQHDRAIQDFDQAIRLDAQFAQGDRTNPVAVGDGRFIFCCRAILLDCRTNVVWAIRNIREDPKHCIEACSRKLRC